MSEQQPPQKSPHRPQSSTDVRQARLDAALRANLKRRKAQVRGRGPDDGGADGVRDTPSIFKSDGGHDSNR